MIKRRTSFGLRCFALVLLIACGGAQAQGYSALYVLGDSLSDTGNLASVTAPFPDPPYYMNRVSNGPVAVEVLAARLGLSADASLHLLGAAQGSNYAVAGARSAGVEPIDLPVQVDFLLLNHGNSLPADALYVVFIGGNDVRDARDAADRMSSDQIIQLAAEGVGTAVQRLLDAGAVKVMVVNAPDIGSIPETQLLADALGDPRIVRKASHYSRRYNTLLADQVEALEQSTGQDLVLYDLFEFLASAIADGAAWEFSNTSEACFSSATFVFHPDCDFGANFDRFLFFDEIHPSARLHERTGRAFDAYAPEANF